MINLCNCPVAHCPIGQDRIASPATAPTDLLAAHIVDKCGPPRTPEGPGRPPPFFRVRARARAITAADARSHGLAAGSLSVDLGQRQRFFGGHAMFSRT